REIFSEMGDGGGHSAFAFLRRDHRASRFQRSRGSYGFRPSRRLFLRTKSLCHEQSRGRGVFAPLLGHERIFLNRIPAFVRSRGRNCFTGRSAVAVAAANRRDRSVPAAQPCQRVTPRGWERLRVCL